MSTTTALTGVTLSSKSRYGASCKHTLDADQGVFVGTTANCGLRLTGEGVADIHCRIGYEDTKLYIQNWISVEDERTAVNGKPLEGKQELKLGDTVEIGTHTISILSADAVCDDDPVCDDVAHDEAHSPQEAGTVAHDAAPADSLIEESPTQASQDTPAEPSRPEQIIQKLQSLSGQTPCDESDPDDLSSIPEAAEEFETLVDDTDAIDTGFFDFEEEETYDSETVALLRAEIEDLQTQLAQRDAESEFDRVNGEQTTETSLPEESDAVLQRMQELIDEANRSDERAALLEEMLHASEVANRSEQDERGQLEAWVGDIEHRIGQREEEHAAELEALRGRLEEANDQQEKLRKKLQQAAFQGNAPKQYEETLDNLQANNKQLAEKLAEAERSNQTLQQKIEQLSEERDGDLRAERAEIAKERAKVSRLRFELSRKLTDIEELPKADNSEDREVAQRLQTLRQHLREIHEHEKQEERDAPLTKRLAKLWKRVEY